MNAPAMVSVYSGRTVLGFILNRGRAGFERIRRRREVDRHLSDAEGGGRRDRAGGGEAVMRALKRKPHVRITPEILRVRARREAQRVTQYGWRPRKKDIAQLKTSTRDAIAYQTLMRAWRFAGFRARTIQQLAGR